jgi:ketosteroid isomerase-like protein
VNRLLVAAVLSVAACSHPAPPAPPAPPHAFIDADKLAITDVITKQAAAWNRGDLGGYMDGYAKIDTLVFTSGGKINRGWQTTYDRFKKRYGSDTSTMGKLSFADLEVTPIGADGAIALGTWSLESGDKSTGGVFTLVFERRAEGWKIVHDHTSSLDKTPPSETGIPECDTYVAAVDKLAECRLLPQASRDAMKEAVNETKAVWKTLDQNGKKTAADSCKLATDSMQQMSRASGCS